ncbi:MAG: sensor histidine kinase [Clostridia bacterium]
MLQAQAPSVKLPAAQSRPVPIAAAFATLPRNIALGVAFNTVIAVGLALAQRHPLSQTLVYSNCIGLSILLLIDVTRRLVWGPRIPPSAALMALTAVGIAVGYVLGSTAGSLLLGYPVRTNLTGNALVTGGVITFFAGIVACAYFMNRERLAELRLQAEAARRAEAQARLEALQAQIEPHFLFNTLANLHSLIGSDPARAQKMLEHLNDYLRATLAGTRKGVATLAEEFTLLRGYLEVVAVRMGPRLAYTLSLPEELSAAKIPPLLLQPLVENAIKHGLEPKVDGGSVQVRAFSNEGRLVIEVADSGLGLGAGAGGKGVGLENVRERLSAVYGPGASLEIVPNPGGGALATVTLPLGDRP